jgi:hypothetical protein
MSLIDRIVAAAVFATLVTIWVDWMLTAGKDDEGQE